VECEILDKKPENLAVAKRKEGRKGKPGFPQRKNHSKTKLKKFLNRQVKEGNLVRSQKCYLRGGGVGGKE